MIEKFEDLGLTSEDNEEEKIDKKIQEKLNISLSDMKIALSEAIKKTADDIVVDIINIIPFGDYEKILEDKKDMSKFLIDEASKPEYWKLDHIKWTLESGLLKFLFACDAVDDGDSFQGIVFVSKNGRIRHAFAQGID